MYSKLEAPRSPTSFIRRVVQSESHLARFPRKGYAVIASKHKPLDGDYLSIEVFALLQYAANRQRYRFLDSARRNTE